MGNAILRKQDDAIKSERCCNTENLICSWLSVRIVQQTPHKHTDPFAWSLKRPTTASNRTGTLVLDKVRNPNSG